MATHRNKKRGVILLVLLGMLALFGATAFAFLVITSHANRAAKSLQRVDRMAFSPKQDVEEAMYQVLRGANNNSSVLRTHSLLDDLYGEVWIGGWVVGGVVWGVFTRFKYLICEFGVLVFFVFRSESLESFGD